MTRYRFANFGGVKVSSRFGFWTGSVRFISQGVAYIVQPMVFIPFLGSFHDSCRLFQIYPAGGGVGGGGYFIYRISGV